MAPLCITICKRSTIFTIHYDKINHRMDYFKNIKRQEDITDIIEFEISNATEYERDLRIIPVIIANNLGSNKVNNVSMIREVQYVRTYDNSEFKKLIKLIKNFKYKYEINIKITHTLFPKLSSRTTNCNSIAELIINYGTKSKRPKDNRYFDQELSEKLLMVIGSDKFNKKINRKLVFNKVTFCSLFNIEPRYKSGKKKLDRYLRLLKDFGVDVKFSNITISRTRLNLFKAGYPLIQDGGPEDNWMKEYTLIKYHKMKLIKDESSKIYESIRRGLGL